MSNVMTSRVPVITGDVLLVGDIHDKARRVLPVVDRLLASGDFNIQRVIMLGDYLNDWGVSSRGEREDFRFLCDWVNAKPDGLVVMVLGNHDLPYLIPRNTAAWRAVRRVAPGFKPKAYTDVHELLTTGRVARVLTPAYAFMTVNGATWLATHAGVTSSWLTAHGHGDLVYSDTLYTSGIAADVVDMMREMVARGGWENLNEAGEMRGGYPGTAPSPLWADRSELIADPLPRVNQIVGHTPVSTPTINMTRTHNPENGLDAYSTLLFTDTMSTDSTGAPLGDSSLTIIHDDTIRINAVTVTEPSTRSNTASTSVSTTPVYTLRPVTTYYAD